jgi:branched-subunit amino acid transport protein AzlD
MAIWKDVLFLELVYEYLAWSGIGLRRLPMMILKNLKWNKFLKVYERTELGE